LKLSFLLIVYRTRVVFYERQYPVTRSTCWVLNQVLPSLSQQSAALLNLRAARLLETHNFVVVFFLY